MSNTSLAASFPNGHRTSEKQLNWFLIKCFRQTNFKRCLTVYRMDILDKQASFHSDGNRQSTFAGHVEGPHSSNNKIK